MTELRDQLGDGIALNPDAPQPPFPVWLNLPARWSLLDINPGTWRRSADTLIDTTFRGARLSGPHRREVLGVIEGLVADVQASGACVSLIVAGRRPGGGAATLGMHVAFGDDGSPASLAHVADRVPRGGTRTELSTPVGPALLQRERMTMAIPTTSTLAALTSLQVFIPIPDTTWTAVIATASAFPELTDPLEQLLIGVAQSFRLDRDDGASGGPGDGAAAAPAEGDAAQPRDAAGAARPADAGAARPADAGAAQPADAGAARPAAAAGVRPAAAAGVRPAAEDAEPTGGRPPRGAGPGIERGFRTTIVKRIGEVADAAEPEGGCSDG